MVLTTKGIRAPHANKNTLNSIFQRFILDADAAKNLLKKLKETFIVFTFFFSKFVDVLLLLDIVHFKFFLILNLKTLIYISNPILQYF